MDAEGGGGGGAEVHCKRAGQLVDRFGRRAAHDRIRLARLAQHEAHARRLTNVFLELRRHVQVGGAGVFLEHVLARDGNGFHSLVDGGRTGRHHLGRLAGLAHHVADGARDFVGR